MAAVIGDVVLEVGNAQTPQAQPWEKAKLIWGGRSWDIQLRERLGGADGRIAEHIAAQLQVPWRWDAEQFSLESGDKIEVSAPKTGLMFLAEVVFCEHKSFPEAVTLAPGIVSDRYTFFQFQWRNA